MKKLSKNMSKRERLCNQSPHHDLPITSRHRSSFVFASMFLALLSHQTQAHVPPSPAEMAHLARLQRQAAERHARRLEPAPDYTCPEGVKSVAEKWRVSGTSLGGWLVLEPWLTPSLFYQFLGADVRYGPDIEKIRSKTGMDQKSFCTALGPAEANRQLRRHWKLWLTEDHIADIARTGSTHVRIPIADWMFTPYGIYDVVEDGVRCNDGALEELDRALNLCQKYNLKALLDMHAWIGSQNGLDNSGETKFVKWASRFESGTSGERHGSHHCRGYTSRTHVCTPVPPHVSSQTCVPGCSRRGDVRAEGDL